MPHKVWIYRTIDHLHFKEEDKEKVILFLNSFYDSLLKINKEQLDKSKSLQYKEEVFVILDKAKARLPLSNEELRKIQIEIEDLTMIFDEESMFKTTPNIIKILISNNKESAKDYLRNRTISEDDIELLSEFGQYTIEALIVYVLSMLFTSHDSMIRVASLVEQLESNVRLQALLLKRRRCKHNKKSFSTTALNKVKKSGTDRKKRSKLDIMYPFGSGLVQFMEDRGLITFINDLRGSVRVIKKQGSYYLPSALYAVCNFDISLLPIKFNLPMVCEPVDWVSACGPGQKPRNLSDLSGGYLSGLTGDIYDRYRLLSSGDINHFYIDIGDNYEDLCRVMNKLQRQAFQINSIWLKYILENENLLVDSGLLMPRFLASMNIKEISIFLREFYMKDEVINKLCSYNDLLQIINKNIQRSRYENLILHLASAYDGYKFYLPAFLDFRGRIYRSGILHFHERDLARSLIVFADSNKSNKNLKTSLAATAFHYKSFDSVDEAIEWIDNIPLNEKNIILQALDAKRPFQFFANIIGLSDNIPITQDASASAYQIMSYFLLDETIAKRTNLIPSSDGKIQDVYSFILEELKEFMKAELDKNLSTQVCNLFTRKLVKGIFMPIIYGKTLMSTASDLKDHLSHFITLKECFIVASVCFKFWKTKYQNMECLIRNIGWIASASDRPVFYKVNYFTTVQDYMIMEAINIWVYDRLHKKRRQVTLRVSSSKRDRRKTEISTFVNFIHQKDAYIAMNVVEYMLCMGAPIYTVHDNFITTSQYSENLPMIFNGVIRNMGAPLSILNEFIYINVIKPIQKREGSYKNGNFTSSEVISKETLHYYLKSNIPDNISKKMMSTWDKRISAILTSYDNYTRIVCGDFQTTKDGWQAHQLKWEKFQLKLKRMEGIPYYSLHY